MYGLVAAYIAGVLSSPESVYVARTLAAFIVNTLWANMKNVIAARPEPVRIEPALKTRSLFVAKDRVRESYNDSVSDAESEGPRSPISNTFSEASSVVSR